MTTKEPQRRDKRRRRLTAAMLVLGCLVVLWGYGLYRFAALIPEQVGDATTRTDAIVVLTGGSGRLDEGLRLLDQRLAGRLFISGVSPGVDVAQLTETVQTATPVRSCCIDIGHAAADTAGNALETAAWVRANGVHSLRLVTSVYHLPRSLLEFRHAMPDAVLVPHPVFAEHVKREQWWLWPGTARLIVGEYAKYLLAMARQGGEALTGRPIQLAIHRSP